MYFMNIIVESYIFFLKKNSKYPSANIEWIPECPMNFEMVKSRWLPCSGGSLRGPSTIP